MFQKKKVWFLLIHTKIQVPIRLLIRPKLRTRKQNKEQPQGSNNSFRYSIAFKHINFFSPIFCELWISIYTKNSVSKTIIRSMLNLWQPFALFLTCTSKTSDSRFSNREEEFNLYIFKLRRQINNRDSLSMQLRTQAEEQSKPGNQAATYLLLWVRHCIRCSWPPNNRATALERWNSISHTENKVTGFGIRKEEMILIAWKHTLL